MASSAALIDWLKREHATNLYAGKGSITTPNNTLTWSAPALVTVRSSDKLSTVFHVLLKNRLLSAPVYDENAQDYTWVVDITDILEAALVFNDEVIPRKTSTAFKELNTGCSSSNDLFKNVELEAVFGMHPSFFSYF